MYSWTGCGTEEREIKHHLSNTVPLTEIGKAEEGTGLKGENPVLLGHAKFEISIRHCVEMSTRHQLDSRRCLILKL